MLVRPIHISKYAPSGCDCQRFAAYNFKVATVLPWFIGRYQEIAVVPS